MQSEIDNRAWYLIYTKPRSEKKARTHLREQGYEVYLPLFQCRKHRGAQWCSVIEPLFPSYVFVRLDDQLDNWAPIRSTPGVTKLVRFGDVPGKVPEEFIEALRTRENEMGLQPIAEPRLRSGDKVRLLEGPMAGLEAVFRTSKGADRALIMLSILGKLTAVEVKRAQLGKIT